MNLWRTLLDIFGWRVDINPAPPEKCVICVAPHTSNWDFILGYAAYRSIGRKANFLMKESWFFPPLGYFFRKMGGIPVPKEKGSSLTEKIIMAFGEEKYLNLAVTPEGTRSPNPDWRKGFLYIALGANVPVMLGVIDFENKSVTIRDAMIPNGDIDADMKFIKNFYRNSTSAARYPEKFKI